jgi:hypothetical protein
VILRVMRGRGGRDQVVALRHVLRDQLAAEGAGRGPERFQLGWRAAPEVTGMDDATAADDAGPDAVHDVVLISQWSAAEAAASADSNETSPLVTARRHLGPINVVHFEVDESIRRQSEEAPVAIRLATGRFSKPGADVEMQNLLRERAPQIAEDMTDAWIGRRLSGRAVEVIFVSCWRGLPAGRSLEDPLWSDIALRYDEFAVEVYSAVEVE